MKQPLDDETSSHQKWLILILVFIAIFPCIIFCLLRINICSRCYEKFAYLKLVRKSNNSKDSVENSEEMQIFTEKQA